MRLELFSVSYPETKIFKFNGTSPRWHGVSLTMTGAGGGECRLSEAYNPYPDERWSTARVIFELVDIDAAEDATATVTSEAEISKLSQTHNRVVEMEKKLATLEQNYFLLDGSFELPDENDNGEVGWWSGEISDSNGQLNQVLEFNFTEPQSSIGFTIAFDEKS